MSVSVPVLSRFPLPRSAGALVYFLAVAGMLCGMVLSLPLWLTGRAFPHVPVFAWCPPLPAPFDAVLLGAVALALLASALMPRTSWLMWAGLAGCVVLALQDQTRWQPWFYQYWLMILLAGMTADRGGPAFLFCCRILLICLYGWSGLHKLTPAYHNLYVATFGPLGEVWPAWAAELVRRAEAPGPWLEIGVAVALCFRVTRRAGVVLAVLTHVAILLMIGPLGLKTNSVVWPWNLIMAALVWLLFWRVPPQENRMLTEPHQRLAAGLALVLCGVMPWLSRYEKWPRYFSYHLYSGDTRRLAMMLDAPAVQGLPEGWRAYVTASPVMKGVQELHYLQWALAELNVPPPGDGGYLLKVAKLSARTKAVWAGAVQFYTDFPFKGAKPPGMPVMFTAGEVMGLRELAPYKEKE